MAQKIMVQTKDRSFFLHKKNLPMLIEFVKTFKAKLSIVDVAPSAVIELKDLVNRFCDQNFDIPKIEYKVLEELYPNSNENTTAKKKPKPKSRWQMRENAKEIKSYIRDTFLNGKVVSLKDVKKKFKKLKLTDSCLSSHITKVRKQLTKEGKKINSPKKGEYVMESKKSEWETFDEMCFEYNKHLKSNKKPISFTSNENGYISVTLDGTGTTDAQWVWS